MLRGSESWNEFVSAVHKPAMAALPSTFVYKVERSEPELITPAKPTPYEFKLLSDIDDQKGFRIYMPTIHFYRNVEGMKGKDPVKVIKEAIAKTLVYYYPLAGRLREGPNGKLMVECTGEGVLFIEANADVRLEQFGDVLVPPFPGGDDLVCDLPSSADILDSPMVLIQVTRLMCGGFIFGLRFNHVITDAGGLAQFMKAIGEIARGAQIPSVQPVWKREYLNARSPPRVTCQHRAFDKLKDIQGMSVQDMGRWPECSYFFGPEELVRLRNQVPPHLRMCSNFEIIFACLWRCRTIALNINSDEEVRAAFPMNGCRKFNPPLPVGFYGNSIASPVAQSSSGKLCQNPLGYALELIIKAKEEVTEEFMRSLADFLVQNGRPQMTMARTFYMTDITRMRFRDVDYGWGKAVYGGTLWGARPSLFASSKNNKGEDGILVTIRLPPTTIERFFIEIEKMVKVPKQTIMSSL